MSIIDGLTFAWNKNRDYAASLVADLDDQQMILQPAPEGKAEANHPAWVLSHLNAYVAVIKSIVQGVDFEDPKGHPFGMLSKPCGDASVYASKESLIAEFVNGHDEVSSLLKSHGEPVLANEIKLERWQEVMPSASIALPYLMLSHENSHLGQLSAWRRIQGMPSV
jgi:hypothetical protein